MAEYTKELTGLMRRMIEQKDGQICKLKETIKGLNATIDSLQGTIAGLNGRRKIL